MFDPSAIPVRISQVDEIEKAESFLLTSSVLAAISSQEHPAYRIGRAVGMLPISRPGGRLLRRSPAGRLVG